MFLRGEGFHLGTEYTLAPERANLKVNAVAFIEHHFLRTGDGCSLRELAAALGHIPCEKARRLVKQLARDEKILRFPGVPRGLLPIGEQARALQLLRKAGYVINPGKLELVAPPVSNSPLPVPIELEHIPDIEFGGGVQHGSDGAGRRPGGA
ncbi:hypothetical protein M9978_02455 [Sphingomonas sp. MG17]|uniref:Uncharacterized protein n=1 Tax=Sphingomonas tagetis TaxID=2949092 RepID=A0A9X2HEE2_9SPHN|nr:hypothetical protein [Sphingomonas tagetis]MCP3729278.1 hypothetical protein [Sphingomonas tagetis]